MLIQQQNGGSEAEEHYKCKNGRDEKRQITAGFVAGFLSVFDVV